MALFERIDSPQELFTFKLGSALNMENKVLDMLGDMEDKAQSNDLKQAFRRHAEETRQHVANVEQAFAAMGEEPDEKPCASMEGLQKQGKAEARMTDDALVDATLLAGADETEHHEIAVYETLITQAQAMGNDQVVTLLRQNLESEQRTLDGVRQAAQMIAQTQMGRAA
jgi:ferritin-like metal-binding protein YciE